MTSSPCLELSGEKNTLFRDVLILIMSSRDPGKQCWLRTRFGRAKASAQKEHRGGALQKLSHISRRSMHSRRQN